MPIEFERDAGNVAVFRISGELGKEELFQNLVSNSRVSILGLWICHYFT